MTLDSSTRDASSSSGTIFGATARAAIALFVVIGVLVWEVNATYRHHVVEPAKEQDWENAVEHLHQLWQTGEPILFAPHWVDPLGRFYFKQITLDLASLSDLDRFSGVWEVSIRNARHPWVRDLTPQKEWRFGAVRVARYAKKAETVLFDFYQQFASATVTQRRQNATSPLETPCASRYRNGVQCSGQSWNWVGPHLAEVNYQPYRCIHAHPQEGHVIRIDYSAVPLGKKLVGYTGIDDFENRRIASAIVSFKVFIGGQEARAIAHQNDWPWRRFEIDTSSLSGRAQPITFEIGTPAAYARTFCFHAETRQ